MSRGERFFLVSSSILPESIVKAAEVKELLASGGVKTINEAVDRVGMSRSAFYKYKDGIFPFLTVSEEKIITLSMLLVHRAGILLKVINTVADTGGNILTINQNIPVQGVANVSISLETGGMKNTLENLIKRLALIEGVNKVEIVS